VTAPLRIVCEWVQGVQPSSCCNSGSRVWVWGFVAWYGW
jgi:hypothetical protein